MFRLCDGNKQKRKQRSSTVCICVPEGASSAAVLAGAVQMKHRRAHKATVPAGAPGAHWESAGQKAQSLTTAKLDKRD